MVGSIRRARADETEALTELALRSKAHWGYDDAFMAACRDELTVTKRQADDGEVWVLDDQTGPVGFYRLSLDAKVGELELLFVRPQAIGGGIGRALWDHMLGEATRRGADRICVDSDPAAEGFYRAMGCRRIGDAPSASIAGRTLPRLELRSAETIKA